MLQIEQPSSATQVENLHKQVDEGIKVSETELIDNCVHIAEKSKPLRRQMQSQDARSASTLGDCGAEASTTSQILFMQLAYALQAPSFAPREISSQLSQDSEDTIWRYVHT